MIEEFFKIIDPTTLNQQGGDIGKQYRTGIYYTSDGSREASKDLAIINSVFSQEQKKDMGVIMELIINQLLLK